MQSFAQFITESTKFDISQFPLASKTPGFQSYLDTINTSLDAKEIPNTVYTELKYALNGIKWPLLKLSSSNSAVRDTMEHSVWLKLHNTWEEIFNWNSDLELHTATGKLKKAEAWLAKNRNTADSAVIEHAEGYIKMAKEMALLGDAMATLKPMIVKRKIKSDAEKAADKKAGYQAPIAANESVRKVNDVLTKMTTQLMPNLIKTIEQNYERDLARFRAIADSPEAFATILNAKYNDRDAQNKKKLLNSTASQFGIKIVHPYGIKRDQPPTVEYPDNLPMRITTKATNAAEFVRDGFLHKNVAKLASILEAKGKLKGDPELRGLNYHNGIFAGDMQVNFADNSSFRVRNQIVFVYNPHDGTYFARFPTTFHDAILPTGVRMPGQPSEKEMNTDFVTASPLSEQNDPEFFAPEPEKWDAKKCAQLVDRPGRDSMGSQLPKGDLYGFRLGKERFNGGIVIDGKWYQGIDHPAPILAPGYSLKNIPSWGWRIVRG